MPLLAPHHTVVVPDLRGTGASERPGNGYAKTNQADDMRGVLEALDLAWYAGAYRGRDRLRGGFSHYRTLLDDGRENRALLDAGPLPMPVLAVGAGSRGATDPAAPLRPHAADVRGVLAPTGHFVAEEAPDWLVAELRRVAR